MKKAMLIFTSFLLLLVSCEEDVIKNESISSFEKSSTFNDFSFPQSTTYLSTELNDVFSILKTAAVEITENTSDENYFDLVVKIDIQKEGVLSNFFANNTLIRGSNINEWPKVMDVNSGNLFDRLSEIQALIDAQNNVTIYVGTIDSMEKGKVNWGLVI